MFTCVCRKFEDIFDVDHFIEYLKNDVRIVRDIPEWFTDKSELFTNIRFLVYSSSSTNDLNIFLALFHFKFDSRTLKETELVNCQ